MPKRTTEPNKKKLHDILIRNAKPKHEGAYVIWDIDQRGLGVRVEPTGYKAFKCVYSFHNRVRWYHIGAVGAIGLSDARKFARKIMLQVLDGKDPAAERRAARTAGTFEELAARYEEHAQKKNRSWRQAAALVRLNLLPRWSKLAPASITRGDVRAMMSRLKPVSANQTLAAASAIFTWAIKNEMSGVTVNPCIGIERNKVQSRERVLADGEIAQFWGKLSPVLRIILLTGQRPGEVRNLHREHIKDGFWCMPGKPEPKRDWPGTKNGRDHRIWLSPAALEIIGEGEGKVFTVSRSVPDATMRDVCRALKVDRATPHDLRRTFGSKVTALGFGRAAMDRILNHADNSIGSVYDRHSYEKEDKHIMETVAAHILSLATRAPEKSNVVRAQFT